VPLAEKGWSDEMLDASVVWGDEEGIATKIGALVDAGADEVALSPFGAGPDPVSSQDDCIRVLGEIAKG
jgi:hypothetical protein